MESSTGSSKTARPPEPCRTKARRASLRSPDIDAVLFAWHERQIGAHLDFLETIAGEAGAPGPRLEAVLRGYAMLAHGHGSGDIGGGEIAALLHRGPHFATAQTRLAAFVAAIIEQGQQAGEVRSDVPAEELARYCLHALGAAGASHSPTATHRLVAVILAGLRSPAGMTPSHGASPAKK